MFPEKIEFDGEKYRTNSFNQTLNLIFKETKHLQGNKKESDSKKSLSYPLGVRCGARTHDTQNHNLVLYQLN